MRRRPRGAVKNRRAATCVCFCFVSMLGAARAQAQQPSPEPPSGQLEHGPPSTSQASRASTIGETAGAQPDDPTLASARTLFWQGHEQYEQANYAAAITLFEQSYAASPQPGTLFNITLAMAHAHRCDDAARTFHQFSELPMSEGELQHAAAIFDSAQAECLAATRESTTVVVVPRAEAPPPPGAPKPSEPQAPAPPPSQGNSAKSQGTTAASASNQAYWNRDRILGWSFAASSVVSAGAAVYFNQRQQSATEEARSIAKENQGGASDEMAELKTEHDWFLVGTGVAVAASAGFAIAATKLLVFNSSSDGSTQMAVALSPDLRLAISGQF